MVFEKDSPHSEKTVKKLQISYCLPYCYEDSNNNSNSNIFLLIKRKETRGKELSVLKDIRDKS